MNEKLTDKPKPKKKPKKLINIIFSQKTTVILLMILQLLIIFVTFAVLSETYRYVQIVLSIIAVILAIHIINTPENPAFKIAWIVPMVIFPVFTAVLYIMMSNQYGVTKVKRQYAEKCSDTKIYLKCNKTLMHNIKKEDRDLYKLANYV